MTRSARKQLEDNEESSSDEEVTSVPARRSQRKMNKPRHLDDFVTYSTITETGVPRDFDEAINCPESANWIQAMQDEYRSIIKNQAWEISVYPFRKGENGSFV